MSTRTHWTPAMLALLREWYPVYLTRVIASALALTDNAVYNKAHVLGLRKSPEFLASVQSGRVQRGKQNPAIVARQFKPGLVPWNKGTRFVAGGRSAETRFKPGQRSHTWQPVGTYRIVPGRTGRTAGGVLERKVNDLPGPTNVRWHPVSRLVWEQAHGPVPRGHIVVFRPGTHTAVLQEITLDRLECISRADNARRNHPRNKSPELANLVQLKGAITRQVNRIVREHEERSRA